MKYVYKEIGPGYRGSVECWPGRKIMNTKMAGPAGLAVAFLAGAVVATALGGGMAAAGAKTQAAVVQGQQVAVHRVISPTVTDQDIALLRQDIRAMKMRVIGENMSLSDAEGQKFWPIYKHYADDLHDVHNEKYALLKQYAETWSTMTDQDALIYVRRSMEVDAAAQALRLKYVPVVTQVLPGKKAATFFQLERKLCLMVDLQLFSQIPLAHEKESSSR
jgi:hypothetical protein